MTTTYTFEQLKEDVRKEAEALRVHATKEELGRLSIATMQPNNVKLCYYGLMTGHCDSPRATELINKCAVVFFDSDSDVDDMYPIYEFKDYRWSAIEFYIGLPEARNANLIAYLRGETNDLDL